MEVVETLLVDQVQQEAASLQRLARRLGPVLVALDASPLHLLGHHGHHVRLVLPDHLPEGGGGGGQRALAGDVLELLLADGHADVAGVDVVPRLAQGHARLVV